MVEKVSLDDKVAAAVDAKLAEASSEATVAGETAPVEQHLEGHFDAIQSHRAEIDGLKRQIEKLWLHIKHFLPAEGPELPDHLKDD